MGVSNSPYGEDEVMSTRSYVYYCNCSGLIVANKQGKVIDEYASINDTLTMTVSCVQATSTIKFFKNERMIYEMKVS
jgi:hypothetical protein